MASSSSGCLFPSAWNVKDTKLTIVELIDGLKIHHKGGSCSTEVDVCANHPIPPSCPLYYFEIQVLSGGRDGRIAVGLSTGSVSMSRAPGWERNSFGFHADSGNIFKGSGRGAPYAQGFQAGDTVGCCYNQVENTITYTKNGKELGVAFTDVKGLTLYPSVSVRSAGEKIEANFGGKPFVFDFQKIHRETKMKTLARIDATEIPHRDTVLNSLVLSYLVHHGYCETAIALVRDAMGSFRPLGEEDIRCMRQRRRIRQGVEAGNIDEAIELTNDLAPEVFMSDPSVLFALKCQKFIEMVRAGKDKETVEFGRAELCDFETETEENKATVQDVFSLLAYKDPSRCPLAYMLELNRREVVAERLNAAILVSRNKPRRPSLEVLHCQAVVSRQQLVDLVGGAASLVDIHTDIQGCCKPTGKIESLTRHVAIQNASPVPMDAATSLWPAPRSS